MFISKKFLILTFAGCMAFSLMDAKPSALKHLKEATIHAILAAMHTTSAITTAGSAITKAASTCANNTLMACGKLVDPYFTKEVYVLDKTLTWFESMPELYKKACIWAGIGTVGIVAMAFIIKALKVKHDTIKDGSLEPQDYQE